MFLTILLLLIAFAMVLSVKARFDSLPPAARNLTLGAAALLTAFVFTVEFFIWLKERLLEFLQAVEGVHWSVVVAVFLLILYGAYRFFRFVTALNQQEISRIFRENVTPHLKEMASEVRDAWKKRKWWRLRLRSKAPEDEGEAPK
jgi:hypothetical protein